MNKPRVFDLTIALFFLAAAPIAAEVTQVEIKRSNARPGISGVSMLPDGGIRATNAPLLQLVMNAYDVQEFQIVGQPDWFASDRYDIEVHPVGSVAPEQQSEAWRSMLQNLLADYFKLSFHREEREKPIYELVVAKNGTKLKPSNAGPCTSTETNPCSGFTASRVSIVGRQVALDQLASRLSRSLGQTVINKANMTGLFDIRIEWTLPQDYRTPAEVGVLPPSSAGLSIFTALEEQLGLTLEPRKGFVEVLVIDRAEKPPGF